MPDRHTESLVMEEAQPDPLAVENRIVIVLDPGLERGVAANRCAVLATGLAVHHPEIIGTNLNTADGREILGFTKVPIAVLAAQDASRLRQLEDRARELGCTTLVFLARAQGLRSYEAYQASVAQSLSTDLDVDAFIVYGSKKAVNKVTGGLAALR